MPSWAVCLVRPPEVFASAGYIESRDDSRVSVDDCRSDSID